MFEVGFTELLLIFALSLVVLGPERLPRVASQVGRWLGRAKAMARQFREQLEQEVEIVEDPYSTLDPTPGSKAARKSEGGSTQTPQERADSQLQADIEAANRGEATDDAPVHPAEEPMVHPADEAIVHPADEPAHPGETEALFTPDPSAATEAAPRASAPGEPWPADPAAPPPASPATDSTEPTRSPHEREA